MPRKFNKDKKNTQPAGKDSKNQDPSPKKSPSKSAKQETQTEQALKSIDKQESMKSQSVSETPHKRQKIHEKDFILEQHLEEASLASTISFFFRHSVRDIGRRKFHYSLAFCSVFIVVLSSLVINTIVEKGPIIFLRLAESHHGECDGYVTPLGSHNRVDMPVMLNYTRIHELYNDTYNLGPRKFLHSGRISFDWETGFYDPHDPRSKKLWQESFDKTLNLPKKESLRNLTFGHQDYKILAFKTEHERKMDMGRDYLNPPMELGECLIHGAFNEAHAKGAELLVFQVPVTNLMNQIIQRYNGIASEIGKQQIKGNFDQVMIRLACRTTLHEKDPGKFNRHWGNYIMMEFDRLLELFSHYMPEDFDDSVYDDFKLFLRHNSTILDEFVDSLVVTLPRPRISHYESSDISQIRSKIAAYLYKIEEALGFFPVTISSELLGDLSNYSRLVLFIGLIFDLIVVLLVIISILLIYSLLMINIETKSFETGVQRMVGLSKTGIIAIVLVQSFLFVFPAVISGFVISVPSLALFSQILMALLRIDVQVIPTNMAIGQALFIGIVIPVLSAIIPINVALAKNLNDALDYQRSKIQAVYMEVLQKGKRNISGLLSFGIFACAYGISIYYLLPLALLSFNFSLILRIFVFILFGMLFALTLIALNSQRLFEIGFTYLFLHFEQSSIKIMVLKNLMAHRQRNKLTAIIYSLGLGFIIFLNVAYKVQLETLRLHELRFRAGYLQVQVQEPKYALSPRVLEPVIKKHMDIIESFSWIPCELDRIDELKVTQSYMNDYSRTNGHKVGIYGVQPSLFEASHTELMDVGYFNTTSNLSMVEQLYTARGSQSFGIGSIVLEKAAIDLNDYKSTVLLDIRSRYQNRMYEMRPGFTLNMAPGFTMTDMDLSIYNKQAVLLSLPMYATYTRQKISELYFERLIIKLKDHHNKDHIKIMKKAFQKALDENGYNGRNYEVRDVLEDSAVLNDIELILQVIFSFVIPITMFLCFFSLTASMSANLYEQSKEIGVLRAIGFQSTSIIRLVVYEAFILVISSSVLGVLIGTFIGWIMTLQQGMFLQLPLKFLFPLGQFLQISVFSVLFGIFSAYGPTKQLIRNPIAKIFRMA